MPAPPIIMGVTTLNSNTFSINASWPASIAPYDVGICIVETANGVVGAPGNGWAEVSASPQSVGVLNDVNATRLSAYWLRATPGNGFPQPLISFTGDHQSTTIIAIRGAIQTGNPFNFITGDTEPSAVTPFTIPGGTTTVDNSLILQIVGSGTDNTTLANASGYTNASLTNLIERFDSWGSAGSGGGFAIVSGVKTTAGAFSATTGSLASAATQARITLAISPRSSYLAADIMPMYGGSESRDTTSPVITNLLPTGGSTLAPDGYITFTIIDANPGIGSLSIYATGSSGLLQVAYRNGGFTSAFSADSTITGNAVSGYNVSVKPNRGWPPGIPIEFKVDATDSHGNLVTLA